MLIRIGGLITILASLTNVSLAQTAPNPRPGLSAPISIGGVLKESPVWEKWRNRFLDPSGRIVDDANGGASHSEGQGYGMLLAVAGADRRAFDLIWSWTRNNLLVRPDQLAAWRWSGRSEPASDKNNASDGDLLIAWALAEAAELWNDPDYFQDSLKATRDITTKLIRKTAHHGVVIMPALAGFSDYDQADGPVVNLSYWVFPAFRRLAQVLPDFDWSGLADNGLVLIDAARFGPSQLPPDWLSLANKQVAPAEAFDKSFGYNSIRIPLYLFWDDEATSERARAFARLWPAGARTIKLTALDGDGVQKAIELKEPGYLALAALAHCATSNVDLPKDFYRFNADQHYYPATLHVLALVAAATRDSPCVNRAALLQDVAPEWRPRRGSLSELAAPVARPALSAPTPEKFQSEFLSSEGPGLLAANGPTGESAATQDADRLFDWSVVIAGLLGSAILAWLAWRYGWSRSVDHSSHDAMRIVKAVAAIEKEDGRQEVLMTPRKLPDSPFSASANEPILAEQIEVAAEACVRLGATIGLIYFEIPFLTQIEKDYGSRPVDAVIALLTREFGRALRPTDHIEVLDRHQFVIAICLLKNAGDLESIARRLGGVLSRQGFHLRGSNSNIPAGKAVYPLDGYKGQELIEAARQDYRAQIDDNEMIEAPKQMDCSPMGTAAPAQRRDIFLVAPAVNTSTPHVVGNKKSKRVKASSETPSG